MACPTKNKSFNKNFIFYSATYEQYRGESCIKCLDMSAKAVACRLSPVLLVILCFRNSCPWFRRCCRRTWQRPRLHRRGPDDRCDSFEALLTCAVDLHARIPGGGWFCKDISNLLSEIAIKSFRKKLVSFLSFFLSFFYIFLFPDS